MRVDQKDQVITLGMMTECEKGSTFLRSQSFHKQSEQASLDLSSITAETREAVFSHLHSVYHTAHTGRRTVWISAGLLQCLSKLRGFSTWFIQLGTAHVLVMLAEDTDINLNISYLRRTFM